MVIFLESLNLTKITAYNRSPRSKYRNTLMRLWGRSKKFEKLIGKFSGGVQWRSIDSVVLQVFVVNFTKKVNKQLL